MERSPTSTATAEQTATEPLPSGCAEGSKETPECHAAEPAEQSAPPPALLDRHVECCLLAYPEQLHENLETALGFDVGLLGLLLTHAECLTRESTVRCARTTREHAECACGLVTEIVEIA